MYVFPLADVFIDSSIVISSCFDFHTGDLARLKHYCDLGIIRLLTSQIVISEIDRNIKQEVQLFSSQLRNFIREKRPINELKYFDEKHRFLFEDFRVLGWDDFVVSQWHEYINATDCQIIPYDSVTLADTIADYFDQKPPFETAKIKKSEFPDAIIIKSLIAYSENHPTTIFVLTQDKGWINAFPDETVLGFKDAPKKYIVVDSINAILRSIYNIDEIDIAKHIFDNIEKINAEIVQISKQNVEDFSVLIDDRFEDIVDIQEEYDEIEEITVNDINLSVSSFEEINNDFISMIFDAEYSLDIAYTYTDYENSIYDSEDKVYLYVKKLRFFQQHISEMSIQVVLEKHEKNSFHVISIAYPYKLNISEDTLIDSCETSDDSLYDF